MSDHWISRRDLEALGVSSSTVYRQSAPRGLWRIRDGASTGGRKPAEFLLESLPIEIQLRWHQLNEDRVSASGSQQEGAPTSPEDETESGASHPVVGLLGSADSEPSPPSERLQVLAEALTRFSPPQREAAERRCVELAKICDQVLTAKKIVVTQPKAGSFHAFTAVCTHAGCIVDSVSGGTINCPCHGSQFAIATGSVVTGPATSPLAPFAIKVQGTSIVAG